MHITLYLANSDEHLICLTDFLNKENKMINIAVCFMGYCVEFDIPESELSDLSLFLSRFIVEFYLKESILSKVYDEYINLDVNDAVALLSEMSETVFDTVLYSKIINTLKVGGRICVDSLIIFNIKPIMQNIYEKVDFLAEKIQIQKEQEAMVAMLRTYCTLNRGQCASALVEFSNENVCTLDLDNAGAQIIKPDSLLTVLTEYSPGKILLKNTELCPEISKLVRDIFKDRVLEK